jgi:CRP-like cAMP-binding protein
MSAVESALERQLSTAIMRGAAKPVMRRLSIGEPLITQGEKGTEIYLILDGIFTAAVDGGPIAEVGPGAVVGERAAREGGTRTATLTASTPARVAVTTSDQLSEEDLVALSVGHEREAEMRGA